MSDDRRDPPGPDPASPAAGRPDRRTLITWLWRLPVIAAVGGGAYGVWRAARVHWIKPPADPTPTFDPGPDRSVAPLSSFASMWASTHFVYEGIPGIVARVPESIPGGLDVDRDDAPPLHLIAFSRVCTHHGCIVDLARDPEAVAVATNYRGDGPSLFCNCHLSVFAPLEGGRAVAGPAQQPLPRIALELRRGTDPDDPDVVAVGTERIDG